VCHFDTSVPIENDKWVQALNRVLPLDVSVLKAAKVAADFNSRFSVIDRFYRYKIVLGVRDPFRTRFAHDYWGELDVVKMQRAGKALVGLHDFRGFTEELDPTVENTKRRIFSLEVKRKRDEIWIDVVGTAFLRGMMRRIAGCLFEIGRGAREVKDAKRILTEWREMHLPVVLPAKGLTLMRIRYGRHPKDHREKENEFTNE